MAPHGYHPPNKVLFSAGFDEGQMSAGQLALPDSYLEIKLPVLHSQDYFIKNPSYDYLKMKTLARQEIEASNRLYMAPKTLLDFC